MKTCNDVRKAFKQNKRIKPAVVDIISILTADERTAWAAMKAVNETWYFNFTSPYLYKDGKKVGLDLKVVAEVISYVTQDETRDGTDFRRMLFAMSHNGEIKIDHVFVKRSSLGGLSGNCLARYKTKEYYLY